MRAQFRRSIRRAVLAAIAVSLGSCVKKEAPPPVTDVPRPLGPTQSLTPVPRFRAVDFVFRNPGRIYRYEESVLRRFGAPAGGTKTVDSVDTRVSAPGPGRLALRTEAQAKMPADAETGIFFEKNAIAVKDGRNAPYVVFPEAVMRGESSTTMSGQMTRKVVGIGSRLVPGRDKPVQTIEIEIRFPITRGNMPLGSVTERFVFARDIGIVFRSREEIESDPPYVRHVPREKLTHSEWTLKSILDP